MSDPRWAPLRLALGLAQITFAAGSAVLLVLQGPSRAALEMVAITFALTLTSWLHFGFRREPPGRR